MFNKWFLRQRPTNQMSVTSFEFVSITIPSMYSSLLWTTKRFNIHRHSPSALSVLWYNSRGLEETGWTRVNNGKGPGISTARFFLPHDQIMTFDWMWTVTCLFKRETVCGVEIIKCATWYADALCILCLHVDVHSSLGQGYCYDVICI